MLISTHKRLCKQVPPSVAVDSKLFKIKKKKKKLERGGFEPLTPEASQITKR